MNEKKHRLSLDRPATYEIIVPGFLDESWSDNAKRMTVNIENSGDAQATITLTGDFDQAALMGLLRQLYSRGIPLISVKWVVNSLGV